jgi:class 3 adenylate cyclase
MREQVVGRSTGTGMWPSPRRWSDPPAPLGAGGPAPTVAAPAAARPPASYTPRHLAERILTEGRALRGERKEVTVLFVDVQGSTELAGALDPER